MSVSPTPRTVLALVAMLVVAAALWRTGRPPQRLQDPSHATPAPSLPWEPAVPPSAGEQAAGERGGQPQQPADFAILYRESVNYRQFIDRALPAARAGNAEAQYFMAAALQFCDETHRMYFRRRDKQLSLDEAVGTWMNRGDYRHIDMVKLAAARCSEVNSHQDPAWGSADDWLARAAQSGQPVALFRKAMKAWLETETNREPAFLKEDGSRYSLEDVRAMVRTAARSLHPEVLFELGGLGLLMDWEDDAVAARGMTWQYVACQRGLDCSAGAQWHRQFCVFDPECRLDEPGMDYLRRVALQRGIFDLEARANQVNEKIAAGDWAALGFGE